MSEFIQSPRQVAQREHMKNPSVSQIPESLAVPIWQTLKRAIQPKLMIWQIAYLYFPLTDSPENKNPRAYWTCHSARLHWMYGLIECIETGRIEQYELPPSIQSECDINKASLEEKARIRLHIRVVSKAIENGDLSWLQSEVIRIWNAYIQLADLPMQSFMPCPEPIRVSGIFSESPAFEGVYPELESESIKRSEVDSYQYWRENHYPAYGVPVAQRYADRLQNDLNLERIINVEGKKLSSDDDPAFDVFGLLDDLEGEKPEPYKLNEHIGSQSPKDTLSSKSLTPDGLPIPWLLKPAKRKRQLPGQMIEAAYRLYRERNNRNPKAPEDLFNLLTPEELPEFVRWRNSQIRPTAVSVELVDGTEWNYKKHLDRAGKIISY